MKVKRLEGSERFEAYKLAAFCFHKRLDDIESEREKREAETFEDWGAFDDDGSLMARIFNRPYDFYLDGIPVKTGGIGAVATFPEYRESGAVRAIFREILPSAYKNGEVLSALFPFSHKFYRKFGYEVIPFENEYKFRPSILAEYRKIPDEEKCGVKRLKQGESAKDFLDVYNEFAPKFNLAARRTEELMLKHVKFEKEYIDRKFSYLFSHNGKNVAYLIFTDEFNPEAAHLKVEECAWTCRTGFKAILNFLSRFSADYGSITLPLPKGTDLLKLIRCDDAYSIETSVSQNFMLRVVNARKLFEIIKRPEDCDFKVKIKDDIIEENNETLHVLGDRTDIIGSDEDADIELDIRALSQLASGCTDLDEALLRDDVRLNGKIEMLRKCFVQKKIFVSEDF